MRVRICSTRTQRPEFRFVTRAACMAFALALLGGSVPTEARKRSTSWQYDGPAFVKNSSYRHLKSKIAKRKDMGRRAHVYLYELLHHDDVAGAQALLDSGIDINGGSQDKTGLIGGTVLNQVLTHAWACAPATDGSWSDYCQSIVVTVRWLIERGADPNVRNWKQRDAEFYLQKGGNTFPLDEWVTELQVPEPAEPLEPVLSSEELIAMEQRDRLERVMTRDAALPADVRRDKYMVALTGHLKNERFDDALEYFELLDRIEMELPAAISFYHGEAFLRTGHPDLAIKKLYDYIAAAGREGEHYTRALELVNEAESDSR